MQGCNRWLNWIWETLVPAHRAQHLAHFPCSMCPPGAVLLRHPAFPGRPCPPRASWSSARIARLLHFSSTLVSPFEEAPARPQERSDLVRLHAVRAIRGNELDGRYKNLDHNTMKTGNVVDYVESIIQYGCRSCSLEEFKRSLSESASNELEEALAVARYRLQGITNEFDDNENPQSQEMENAVARVESVQCD